jgi:hypothetical protein
MPRITALLGVALVLLGVGGYFATGMVSVTAMIPAFLGVPLVALGMLGRRPAWRKTLMHLALVLTLIGLAGAARGLPGLFQLAGGLEVARPAAVVAQSAMALLCLLHLALGIRSFVLARVVKK